MNYLNRMSNIGWIKLNTGYSIRKLDKYPIDKIDIEGEKFFHPENWLKNLR